MFGTTVMVVEKMLSEDLFRYATETAPSFGKQIVFRTKTDNFHRSSKIKFFVKLLRTYVTDKFVANSVYEH